MKIIKTSRLKRIKWGLLYFGILSILLSPLYMYFSHDVSELNNSYPHIQIKEDLSVNYQLQKKKPKGWASLKEISKYAKWAIVLSEDWGFYDHQGIDVNQMKVAFDEMLGGTRFRGASTITQQTVKNIFLSEERTLWRKIHEIILAQKLERAVKKDRILEVYLNSIEFGPGIYGIRNASLHYFKKAPRYVTPREGAFLAMMLPSPKRYYSSFKKKELSPFASKRIKAVLGKMKMGKVITKEVYEQELNRKFSWEKN